MSVAKSNGPAVVLHADDFGMNSAVNQGILRTFREGILTSTSILANAPFAADACAAWPRLIADLLAGSLPSMERRGRLGDVHLPFDVGIHLNLTQGIPLSGEAYPAALLNDRGQFPGAGRVFQKLLSRGTRWREVVRAELRLQVEWIMDHGILPTHLNGHQYVELIPGVAELIPELLKRYSIPVMRIARETHLARTVLASGRLLSYGVGIIKRYFAQKPQSELLPSKIISPDRYFGTSHAGRVDLTTLQQFLRHASPNGYTEICLHPADKADSNLARAADGWHDPLASLRPLEASWLCGDLAPNLIASHGIRLGRLSELAVGCVQSSERTIQG